MILWESRRLELKRRPIDDPDIAAAGVLFEAAARLDRLLDRGLREQCGITHAWFEVMMRLDRMPRRRMRIGQLGEEMVLTSGGITRLVDRMVEEGLIARERSSTDGRSFLAVLTPSGQRRLKAAAVIHAQNVGREFTGVLGAKRTAAVVEGLDLIRQRGDE